MDPKKHPKADLEKKKNLFMQIGMITALAIVLIAFEWRSYDINAFDLGDLMMENIDEEIIPITEQEVKPPPPPPPPEELIIVKDEKKLEEEFKVENTDVDEKTEIKEMPDVDEEFDEQQIFRAVEEMPSFPGGEAALFKYLKDNIKYTEMARESGISGTVYVTFVINQQGDIADAKVIRGIGGGLDQVALRIVKNMPKWSAGKQRGKPVRVQYNLPVKFKLH